MSRVKLTTVSRNQIGDIHMATFLKDGTLLIVGTSGEAREQADSMREIELFKVASASCIERASEWSKGVIWWGPVGVTTEEVKSNLEGGILKGAWGLQVTLEGAREDSEFVVLDFEEQVLPKKVTLSFLSYSVREYVPKPMSCYKCQRFRHTAMKCKSRRGCTRCGEDHEYGQCNLEQPKCCNCGGNHSVAYRGCEVMKREMGIQQVRAHRKVTYAEAVKMVSQRRN